MFLIIKEMRLRQRDWYIGIIQRKDVNKVVSGLNCKSVHSSMKGWCRVIGDKFQKRS